MTRQDCTIGHRHAPSARSLPECSKRGGRDAGFLGNRLLSGLAQVLALTAVLALRRRGHGLDRGERALTRGHAGAGPAQASIGAGYVRTRAKLPTAAPAAARAGSGTSSRPAAARR